MIGASDPGHVNGPPPGWERPAPLAPVADLPGFPTQALPGWVRDFVEQLAEATQTPPDMAAMFALAALATVCGGKATVYPKPDWSEGVNLFVAVVMEPGSRKSAVHRAICEPIASYEQMLAKEAGPQIVEAAARQRMAAKAAEQAERMAANSGPDDRAELEQLAIEKARLAAEIETPASPRLSADDCTPEALASLLHEQGGRIAVLSAEGGIFEQMAGRYSNGIPNLDVFLKGHAGDPLRVDRRNRPDEYVERPTLTIGLAVQPVVLARLKEFAGRGVAERFLFAIPEGNVGQRRTDPPPVETMAKESYAQQLLVLARSLAALDEPVRLELDLDAAGLFREWREQIEPRRLAVGDLGHVQAWASKLDGAAVRIAGLLHLAEHLNDGYGKPIDASTMGRALRVADYCIPHALAAYATMGADPALQSARHVLDWIRSKRLESFTHRDAHRALASRFHRAGDLASPLAVLEQHGYIRARPVEQSGKQGGRPSSQRYDVSPYALDRTDTTDTTPSKPSDFPAFCRFCRFCRGYQRFA